MRAIVISIASINVYVTTILHNSNRKDDEPNYEILGADIIIISSISLKLVSFKSLNLAWMTP